MYVYGDFVGMSPCFLALETAERLAIEGDDISYGYETSIGQYIERCRTRPEVYPEEWVDDLIEHFEEWAVPLESAFTIDQMPGHGDGWFPTDARTAILDDMPEAVTESGIGTIHDEMGGMPMYVIGDADIDGIRAILEGLGHTVRHDQEIFDRM
jgi:hypothetical protein